ncbi:MAG: hypothetical protein PHS47_02280 [Methanocellales archaeon]|nr:hypothetical protein [Methanocellales archaeon]MDD3421112.1 hypothetical protein [Methanocellales archaeon]MDD4898370.1 hypothetical protein [Methanocellales archaeon]MDD5446730.1 hypothetical protein [Methanocellales archaeon]
MLDKLSRPRKFWPLEGIATVCIDYLHDTANQCIDKIHACIG